MSNKIVWKAACVDTRLDNSKSRTLKRAVSAPPRNGSWGDDAKQEGTSQCFSLAPASKWLSTFLASETFRTAGSGTRFRGDFPCRSTPWLARACPKAEQEVSKPWSV